MPDLTYLLGKLGAMFRGERFRSELEEEMAFHREQLQTELREEGLTAEEAKYAARRRFGNELRLREEAHDVAGLSLQTAIQDLRYALRQTRKNPGFTATVIAILALGIGATTAIFSIVNPILFESLPYPQPRQLAIIWEAQEDGTPQAVRFGSFSGIRELNRSFEALAVERAWQPTITSSSEPERLNGERVSTDYFRVLGIEPLLGRGFQGSDDRFNGPNVVILSDTLWRRRFNADLTILGRAITLNNEPYTVIGIMPRGFENVLEPAAELWAPLQYDPALPPEGREWGHHLRLVARLRAGVTYKQAASELTGILPLWGPAHAAGYKSSGGIPKLFLVHPLRDDLTSDVRPALLAVLGAVALVLLIACVNVTNLLLARSAIRQGEFAMRAALGASRTRIVRQMLTESLMLALVGGALAMGLGAIGTRALLTLSPPDVPRLSAVHVDIRVFLFGFVVTTLVGVAFGITPALQASRHGLQAGMQQTSQRTVGGHHLTRRVLVVVEVALALVLLTSAGLLLRSVRRIFEQPPGFEPVHLLTMQVQESRYRSRVDADRERTNAARDRFFSAALEAVRQVPGVREAAFTSQLPLSGDSETYGMEFAAYPNENFEPAFRYAVSPDYFATMRIPLLRGRFIDERDRAGAPVAVVISESLAKRKFPGQDPIGQRVRTGPDAGHSDKPWNVIVGVVGDVKQASLAVSDAEAFYTSPTQWSWVDNVQSLVVRTSGDAASLAPAVRRAIWSVDKDQPIVRVATMDRLVAASESQRNFALVLFELFALVALVLAATGIYGVLSGSVTERTREIGVRSALGASRSNLLALVFRQGMTLATMGVAIGFIGALAASRALMSLLFSVTPMDPLTYGTVAALLLCVAGCACALPAYRAAGIDPAITLRAE